MADGVELGTAYVSVIPEVSKVGTIIRDSLMGAGQHADEAGKSLGERLGVSMAGALQNPIGELKNTLSGIGDIAKSGDGALGFSGPALAAVGAVAGIGSAAIGVTKALFEMGKGWAEITDEITYRTGLVGEKAEEVTDKVGKISTNTAASTGLIADVAGQVIQSLHLEGQAFDDVTKQISDYDQMHKDAPLNIRDFGKAMHEMKVPTEDFGKQLDELNNVAQNTGIPLNTLIEDLKTGAVPAQDLGLSVHGLANLLGTLEDSGLNSEKAMAALRIGLGNLSKPKMRADFGDDPETALTGVITHIQSLLDQGKQAEAVDLGKQIFGKSWTDFFQLIQDHKLDIKQLNDDLGQTGPTIEQQRTATEHAGEQWTIFKNKVSDALKPLSTKVFKDIDDDLMSLGNWVSAHGDGVNRFFSDLWNILGPFQALGHVFDGITSGLDKLTHLFPDGGGGVAGSSDGSPGVPYNPTAPMLPNTPGSTGPSNPLNPNNIYGNEVTPGNLVPGLLGHGGAGGGPRGLGGLMPQGLMTSLGGIRSDAPGGQLPDYEKYAMGESGKPYEYGGEDCSGYVSNVWGVMTGKGPGRYFNTESDFASMGFHKGTMPGALNIGVHHGGGGPNSHMSATLPDGVNIESGGAANKVQYGGQAAGAFNKEFEDHWWFMPGYNTGGQVDTVPAMLTPGEHVLTVDDVKALGGHDAVYAMRQHLADGGQVDPNKQLQHGDRSAGFIPTGAAETGTPGTSMLSGFLNLGSDAINTAIDMAAQGGGAAANAAAPGSGLAVQMGANVAKQGVKYGFQMAGIGIDSLMQIVSPFGLPRWAGYDYSAFLPHLTPQGQPLTTGEKAQKPPGDQHLPAGATPGQPIPPGPGGPVQPGTLPGQSTVAPPAPFGLTGQQQQKQGALGGLGAMLGFDQGGMMPPGGIGVNMTKTPEPVFTSSQWDQIAANLPPENTGSGPNFGVHMEHVYTQDADDLKRQIESQQRLAVMRYSGRPF